MTFEEVWNELKSEDTTGVFAKAEELSLVSVEAIEYAFNSGYAEAKAKFERPKGKWIKDCDSCDCSNCYNSGARFTRKDCSGKCSNCGELKCCTDNFCPNCGADMRGEENETN